MWFLFQLSVSGMSTGESSDNKNVKIGTWLLVSLYMYDYTMRGMIAIRSNL